MKVRSIPETSVVKAILTERIGEASSLLAEDDAKLAKLTGTEGRTIYNQYQDSEVKALKASIAGRTEYIALRKAELGMLESHAAPRVCVEIEL